MLGLGGFIGVAFAVDVMFCPTCGGRLGLVVVLRIRFSGRTTRDCSGSASSTARIGLGNLSSVILFSSTAKRSEGLFWACPLGPHQV